MLGPEGQFATKEQTEECLGALGAVQDALYVLNGKWKLPIIIALGEGNKRFGELQKTVKGISAKVLSHELKHLELNEFIRRHVYNTMPVSVEYELTAYSATLHNVIESLREWGMQHRQRIRTHAKEKKAVGV
ncbi:MAG TPA: helix-turn-helix domain-containing protein [Chitinophaga sp.]|uniref:winged helix-turn-helix transcriptional regulator n=1 Tax=Chitinophaga sp. TaxID=1869181 RepID=UPI002DB7A869|nr:helix-turn-helix domain-containing protein [Chitinophaga sp.]HEU4552155.1 helix-turn-helix domain-containing protein [Chitinophaga sp.]